MRSRVLLVALLSGLVLSCADDLVSSDDGPSACIGGDLCVGDLVCVDGFCVAPGDETGETGESGDGDGDPGDGDGDCELGTEGCACEPNKICDAGLSCVNDLCVSEACGNGVEDPGEACDDGNDDNTDTCLNSCELASCGDGIVGPGEGCDDGNDIDDDECDNACTLTSCGDGVTQVPEECDDGNAADDDTCLSTCVDASCGDGYVQQGVEDCDDANPNDADACLSSCEDASCGDGFLQDGVEECDDGNLANTDACVDGCVPSECGDGFVQDGVEECDDANMVNTDTCLIGCVAASCGDGFVGPGEGCDDANNINDDACNNLCSLTSCGDGAVQMGEACDDGNLSNLDACLNTCVAASCGDGWPQANVEECDDANADNTDSCINSCDQAGCGDGYVWQGSEECDDGNGNNADGCPSSCDLAECGDGFVQQGVEACDDGNVSNTDACLASCNVASCGDGFVRLNVEECDDANGNNNDMCLNNCDLAACGDAVIQQGVEECDNGLNNANSGMCTAGCDVAFCGDSFVWVGMEECDDGNMVANDGCDACDGNTPLTLTRGEDHSCLMLTNGTIRCWGDGAYGQLGVGSISDIGDGPGEMPPAAVNVGGVPIQLHTGEETNYALLATGEVRAWGWNDYGQCGVGSTAGIGDAPGEMPPASINVGGQVAQIAAGSRHACVLLVNGLVRCWGYNNYGQLGIGNVTNIGDGPGEMPPAAVNFGVGNVVQLAAGAYHNCVLLDTNKVRCWGQNTYGQLGIGNVTTIGDGPGEMPPADVNVGAGVITQLALFMYGGCVLFDNGQLRCWGYNASGALGIGSLLAIGDGPGEMPPVNVTNYGAGVVSELHGGSNFVQVLMADGTVRGWGKGLALGYGSINDLGDGPGEMPTGTVSLGGTVLALSKGNSGSLHSCVVLQDMTVHCWGESSDGQLGYGNLLTIGDAPGEMPPLVVQAY